MVLDLDVLIVQLSSPLIGFVVGALLLFDDAQGPLQVRVQFLAAHASRPPIGRRLSFLLRA